MGNSSSCNTRNKCDDCGGTVYKKPNPRSHSVNRCCEVESRKKRYEP